MEECIYYYIKIMRPIEMESFTGIKGQNIFVTIKILVIPLHLYITTKKYLKVNIIK